MDHEFFVMEDNRVIGLDISNDIIDYASSKYGTKVLEFRVGDILNIDFVNNNFDVITCFRTIEHVNNQKRRLWSFREF